jgi:methionyl aminopeptidase
MIILKSEEEINLIRVSGQLLAKTLGYVSTLVKPGVQTKTLDKKAEEFIRDHGGEPSFLGYNGFPATLCISVNDQVVHGIPGENFLIDGDIVSVDCGVKLKGFHSDSAFTFPVGEVKAEVMNLLRITKECLYKGIEKAVDGNRVGDISFAVQRHAEENGYTVVRELVGHGIGRHLHEAPEVPNFGKAGKGPLLRTGTVIAIEPMINMGLKEVRQWADGWTISTRDKMPSAHFEHTVVVQKGAAEILTSFNWIELNNKI